MSKYALLLNASPDDVGPAANGLEYALDLDDAGHEVDVFFDGVATQWPGTLVEKPEHPVNEYFQEADDRGLVGGACGFCANPLVVWPAVEFYLPSIPLSGALSVGTVLVIGLLAVLIGINTALMTTVWQRDIELSTTVGAGGTVATTGATACCCCGPAVYAIASAILGVSASPLYWAFLAPSSPLGALFFVGAVALLTGSSVRLTHSLNEAGVCDRSGTHTAIVPRKG